MRHWVFESSHSYAHTVMPSALSHNMSLLTSSHGAQHEIVLAHISISRKRAPPLPQANCLISLEKRNQPCWSLSGSCELAWPGPPFQSTTCYQTQVHIIRKLGDLYRQDTYVQFKHILCFTVLTCLLKWSHDWLSSELAWCHLLKAPLPLFPSSNISIDSILCPINFKQRWLPHFW